MSISFALVLIANAKERTCLAEYRLEYIFFVANFDVIIGVADRSEPFPFSPSNLHG